VEHDVEQRAVNFQPAVVVDEAHLSEAIHKEINPGSGGADHFRQGFLAYFGDHVFRTPFLAKTSQQQESPGQPLFGGVEELIDQVGLRLIIAADEIGDEQI